MMKIKDALKLEELAMFILAALAFVNLGGSWLMFLLASFLPDLSMVGYLINTRVGAYTYNIVHHKGVAILIYLIGFMTLGHNSGANILMLSGLVLFAHSSMDRFFGFGLKYADAFNNTHLGKIKNTPSI